MVINEISKLITAPAQIDALLSISKIIETSFSPDELIKILSFKTKYPSLSIEDSSCLYYAKENSAILLTGDGALRKSAYKESVTVMGTLGILDLLVKQLIIDTK